MRFEDVEIDKLKSYKEFLALVGEDLDKKPATMEVLTDEFIGKCFDLNARMRLLNDADWRKEYGTPSKTEKKEAINNAIEEVYKQVVEKVNEKHPELTMGTCGIDVESTDGKAKMLLVLSHYMNMNENGGN